jgi:hypothetical protein
MKNEYDPIKILNKSKFLNEAAIKCRYDLMHINRFYDSQGINFKKSVFLPYIHHKFDRDIVEYGNKFKNSSYQDLKAKAEMIYNKINESSILEKLNKIDHTANSNLKSLRMKTELGNRMNNAITLESLLNSENIENDKDQNCDKNNYVSTQNSSILKYKPQLNTVYEIPSRNRRFKVSPTPENKKLITNQFVEEAMNLSKMPNNEDFSKTSFQAKRMKLILPLKKRKTHKSKIFKDEKLNPENTEGDDLTKYVYTEVKKFNNYSLNNYDPVKGEFDLKNKYWEKALNQSHNFYNFLQTNETNEKENEGNSDLKNKNSYNKTYMDEFSICTYNNTQHLIKNFLVKPDQSKKQTKDQKLSIRIINNAHSKNITTYNYLKTEKILLSDLLDEGDNSNCKTLKIKQKNTLNTNLKSSNSIKSLFSIKDREKLSNSNEKKLPVLKKVSSKFRVNPKIEKFDTFVKKMEMTVNSKMEGISKSINSNRVKKEAVMHKINDKKRHDIIKNIESVNKNIESLTEMVSDVLKNVKLEVENFRYSGEDI